MTEPRMLNDLSDLKNSTFGRPHPRHGLKLLYWLAKEFLFFNNNNKMFFHYNPCNAFYGFHRFENRNDKDGTKLLPDTNNPYYILGNLKSNQSDDLPYYVRKDHTEFISSSNMDRIIVSVDDQNIENVYVTEHRDRRDFNKKATFLISKELLLTIREMNFAEFLFQSGYFRSRTRRNRVLSLPLEVQDPRNWASSLPEDERDQRNWASNVPEEVQDQRNRVSSLPADKQDQINWAFSLSEEEPDQRNWVSSVPGEEQEQRNWVFRLPKDKQHQRNWAFSLLEEEPDQRNWVSSVPEEEQDRRNWAFILPEEEQDRRNWAFSLPEEKQDRRNWVLDVPEENCVPDPAEKSCKVPLNAVCLIFLLLICTCLGIFYKLVDVTDWSVKSVVFWCCLFAVSGVMIVLPVRHSVSQFFSGGLNNTRMTDLQL